MGRPLGGYEYSYEFRGEDGIKSLYGRQVGLLEHFKGGVLFEIRTKFSVKRQNKKKKKVVGSERFAVAVLPQEAEEEDLQSELDFRLKADYWMSDHEIQSLAREAFDFARRTAKSPVNAVVVELDVCTVQQDGESNGAVARRAIRPEHLVPIYVWPLVPRGITKFDESSYLTRKSMFWELPRFRLEDGATDGGVCPACSRVFSVGDQVYNSLPPGCNHACHTHCLFKMFRKRRYSCPSCHVHIPRDSLEELPESVMKRLKQGGDSVCV